MYPNGPQRSALARAFGCSRVVYNDALRACETARTEGAPFPKTGDLSKLLIIEAKKTDERAWLGGISAVVLQQSLRDLDTAYRNFFDSLKGKRPRMGAPRFKSRKDNRQSVRFTANARWKITTGGDLSLPKIGDVRVKWSRMLPCTLSTVTVIKDAAGRYFCSFVIETGTGETLPEAAGQVGIDLGLTHFAILSTERRSTARFAAHLTETCASGSTSVITAVAITPGRNQRRPGPARHPHLLGPSQVTAPST